MALFSVRKPVPFFSTVGIEFTWLIEDKKGNSLRDGLAPAAEQMYSLLSQKLAPQLMPFRIHEDAGAIEVSTPPLATLDQVKEFYDAASEAAGKIGLVTHARKNSSGGGHIHVGIPKAILRDDALLMTFLANLFRDVNGRPYLRWAFSEWCEKDNAQNFVSSGALKIGSLSDDYDLSSGDPFLLLGLVLKSKDRIMIPLGSTRKDLLRGFEVSKTCCVRVKVDHSRPDDHYYTTRVGSHINRRAKVGTTVEFRFFDMARDWSQVVLHLNFLNSYLARIFARSRTGRLERSGVQNEDDIKAFRSGDRGIHEFRELLGSLGLDPKHYGRFIQMNYRRREKAKLLL